MMINLNKQHFTKNLCFSPSHHFRKTCVRQVWKMCEVCTFSHSFCVYRHQLICGNGVCMVFVHMHYLYMWPHVAPCPQGAIFPSVFSFPSSCNGCICFGVYPGQYMTQDFSGEAMWMERYHDRLCSNNVVSIYGVYTVYLTEIVWCVKKETLKKAKKLAALMNKRFECN